MLTVQPTRTECRLRNPCMGFIYSGAESPPDLADVHYLTVTWGELEPSEGDFRWDLPLLSDAFSNAARRGMRIALRVITSFQNHPWATPRWVHELGVGRFPIDLSATFDQHDIFEPEWWHPVYGKKYAAFIAALGKEFDGREGLDYVDIRSYGVWGEGHRYSTTVPWPEQQVPKRDLLVRFTDHYLAAFKRTPLAVSMARDKDTPYPEGTAIDHALAHGCWMRRDGFGLFLAPEEIREMQAHWKTSVLIAENGLAYRDHVLGKVRRFWEPDSLPIPLERAFDEMLEMHCNYIPFGWGWPDWQTIRWRPDLLKRAWLRMGYRFVVSEARFPESVRRGEEVSLETEWTNLGVGRLPIPHPLAVYLVDVTGVAREVFVDESFDQGAWYADEPHPFAHRFMVPRDLPAGEYRIAVALIDRHTRRPAIALALEADDAERRYLLGSITVR